MSPSGAVQQAMTGSNGIALNGIALNGIALNGIALNGIALNGIALNGIALNGIALNGAALDEVQEANLQTLLSYIVSCALPAGQSVTIHASDGTSRSLAGALGLAPAWRDGPLDVSGQHRVSACLAARTNALAQPVSLSLRHPDLRVDAVEASVFDSHEGAFWGTLFGSEPFIAACLVDGAGLSGRVCAESDSCGFILAGDCADVCDSYDPVMGYSGCGEERTSAVINTYLNLGQRLSFGQEQMCALDQGSLSCWGRNDQGQLGDGSTIDRYAPAPVSGLDGDVAEAAVDAHGCARTHDGELLCWGRNDRGQLGDGSTIDRYAPVVVAGDMASFTMGSEHTCAIRTDSSVWCWGDNGRGQLGLGADTGYTAAPARVQALPSGAARLASSTSAAHTCALDSEGTVWCWGANQHGQLGDGSELDRHQPVEVAVDEDGHEFGEVTDMCASSRLTCARKADGTMWCWGLDRAMRPRYLASGVAPGGLACGEQHACFVREDDATVWCVGANQHGQLGHATRRAKSETPVQVEGLDAVSSVAAARTHTCATRVDGSLWCWGTDPGSQSHAGRSLFPGGLSRTPTRIDLALP